MDRSPEKARCLENAGSLSLGRSKRRRRLAMALLGTTMLSQAGCLNLKEYYCNGFKVGPNYRQPAAAVAPNWIDADDKRVRTETPDLSIWWTVFDDPVLNDLIPSAYQQNLTLREAGYRVLQARAELGITVGNIFPQSQTAQGGYTREGVSLEVANRQFTPQRYFSTFDYGFGLSWELDFWGRFRRAIESAEDTLEASVYDYDDVLVTLLGDVATNYVQLRTLQQQLEYVRANVALQETTLTLAEARFRGGQTSELDVDQSKSTLAQTQSQIPQLEIQIRQTTNRLCVLLGVPPEELQAKLGPGKIPAAPTDAVVGIPADLLRRRPDVRREERRAAAQSEQIGIAETDFYPAISIDGNIGFAAQNFGDQFRGSAMQGSIGPSFNWKLLNYGRIVNNVRLQEARFQEIVARYQDTVLRANEEVENGLVLFLRSQQTYEYLKQSVDAAEKAVQLAIVQYKGGTVDFNRVALLQQNLVDQQDLLAQAQGDISLGLIQVYRALGGGWEIRCTAANPNGPASGHEAVMELDLQAPPQSAPVEGGPVETPVVPSPVIKPEDLDGR